MLVTSNKERYERKFQFGRGNIWTVASDIVSKLLGKVTSNAMKETVKSVAKKTAQDIGKHALQQVGKKGAQLAKDKFSKLLASKSNKKSNVKTQLNEILATNPFNGYGPSIGNTLTEGMGIKKI